MRARELSFTGRTIVVTGGTGFLGSHLVPFVCSSLSSTPRPLVATYSSSNNKINRTSLKLASRGASIKVIARRVANTIDEKLEHFFHRGLEWCQLSRSEIHTLFGGATDDQIIETLCSRISCFSGSVDDLEFMNLVSRDADVIVHLAGLVIHSRVGTDPSNPTADVSRSELYRVNVDGTLAVIEAAALNQVKKVVIASTSGTVACAERKSSLSDELGKVSSALFWPSKTQTYNDLQRNGSSSLDQQKIGSDSDPYCEEICRRWPYYHSKIIAEKRGMGLALTKRVPVVFMRPSMILGPGDLRLRSTMTIHSFLHRHIPYIPNGGVSFVDVRDVAYAFAAAIDHAEPFSTYLLSSANWPMEEFFHQLSQLSGVPPPPIRYLPDCIAKFGASLLDRFNRFKGEWKPSHDPVRAEMGSCVWYVDNRKSQKELGFSPRNPFSTLSETIEWIREKEQNGGSPRARL